MVDNECAMKGNNTIEKDNKAISFFLAIQPWQTSDKDGGNNGVLGWTMKGIETNDKGIGVDTKGIRKGDEGKWTIGALREQMKNKCSHWHIKFLSCSILQVLLFLILPNFWHLLHHYGIGPNVNSNIHLNFHLDKNIHLFFKDMMKCVEMCWDILRHLKLRDVPRMLEGGPKLSDLFMDNTANKLFL